MPRTSSWFIRTALAYMAAGFTLGALMLANKGVSFYPPLWRTMTIHMELLMMGWLVQLALGVAFWILPRFTRGAPRGNERLIQLAFVLINLGIGLVCADTFFTTPGLVLTGRLAELGAILLFVAGTWRRVRPTVPG